jgi:hypothetical protein
MSHVMSSAKINVECFGECGCVVSLRKRGYTDEWLDAEMTESIQRAREVLAAGIAQLAIENARHRG